jgi:hypothetical protein
MVGNDWLERPHPAVIVTTDRKFNVRSFELHLKLFALSRTTLLLSMLVVWNYSLMLRVSSLKEGTWVQFVKHPTVPVRPSWSQYSTLEKFLKSGVNLSLRNAQFIFHRSSISCPA